MGPLSDVDYGDIQGLLRFGYGRLTNACFLLLRIDDASAASSWISHAPISSAELRNPPPSRSLQIAFTHQGLRGFGVSDEILSGFSAEFLSGMAGDDNRSRRLGDIGANSPEYWLWGGADSTPDMVAMLYSTPEQFEIWKQEIQTELSQSGFTLLTCLPTSDMDGVEPFGFVDGVSSPTVDWEPRRAPSGDKLDYENVVMLGEFVLGYPNEYGKYTTRPLISDPSADLPDAEDAPGMKDIGRNGTYLVMRQIEQDVRGFWRYLNRQAEGDHDRSQYFAERLVGRRMSGDPLLPLTKGNINGVGPDLDDINRNCFTFESDPDGVVCPLGAHVRRANPRNADLPTGTPSGVIGRLLRILALDRLSGNAGASRDLVASTRFHRLLRRGREYGPEVTPAQRLEAAPSGELPTGLNFICLSANIGRQFEFIQSAWIMNSKFDGLDGESDPLLGNREAIAGCPANTFSLPVSDGVRRHLEGVPRFTTVRGGAYFFLPGLRALRYLASAASVSTR
jgi:deferrochelatase/peroxidase EfeB